MVSCHMPSSPFFYLLEGAGLRDFLSAKGVHRTAGRDLFNHKNTKGRCALPDYGLEP